DGEVVKISYLGMPNIKYGQMPPRSELESGPGDDIRWFVPIDDSEHVYFVIHLSHVRADGVAEFRARLAAEQAALTASTSELCTEVLAGRRSIHEVSSERDRVPIVETQDAVAQVGQGASVDRSADHLGRSDHNVVLFRRIWSRELRALAEGRPLTQWSGAERFSAHRPVIVK